MDEQKLIELKVETVEEAAALLEDLAHLRGVLSKSEPTRAELRNVSITLRRLLSQNERLKHIALPRVGNIKIPMPDNSPFYRESRKRSYQLFLSGGATIFGLSMAAILLMRGGQRIDAARDYKPGTLKPQRLITFVRQPVICFNNTWVTRKQVIEYVANVMNVAHSDNPAKKDDDDYILDRVRQFGSLKSGHGLTINVDAAKPITLPFVYDPDSVDVVLFELLSAVDFLVNAPDVQRLEEYIRGELAAHST